MLSAAMDGTDDVPFNSYDPSADPSADVPASNGNLLASALPPQPSIGPPTSLYENCFTHMLTWLMICM